MGGDAIADARVFNKTRVEVNGRDFAEATAGGGDELPLTLVGGSASDKVRVVTGYVNGSMPTLGAVALDADPAPEITLAVAETHVWIKCVAVYASGFTFTIETSTSSTPPAGATISGTGFTSFHWIGRCDVAGSVVTISNSQGGNLGVNSFGNINLWWRQ